MVIAPNCLIYRHARKRQRSIDSHPLQNRSPKAKGKAQDGNLVFWNGVNR